MNEIQAYRSSLGDTASRRLGTFSYLPPMSGQDLRKQVAYIIAQGWSPAIEHCEPENAGSHFWYLWKLPLFGETDVDRVMAETDACHEAFPNHHVRLIGLDRVRQTQGTAMVVYRARPGAAADKGG